MRCLGGSIWLTDFNARAVFQFVLPIGDYNLADPHATPDRALICLRERNGHGARFHGLIAFHNIDKISLRPALHGYAGNDRAALANIKQQTNVDELIGKKGAILLLSNIAFRRSVPVD